MSISEPIMITLYATMQALLCAIGALLIALPSAYFLWLYSFSGQRLFNALLHVCSVMPTKAAVVAVDLCYHTHGSIGISIGMLFINIPFAMLLMQQAYGCVDRLSILVAAGLGASPWRCYRDIIWPQIYAAVKNAAGIIFVLCFCAVSFAPMLGNQWYHATPDSMMQQAYQKGDIVQVFVYGCIRFVLLLAIGYNIAKSKQILLPTHIQIDHTRQRYCILKTPWWAVMLGIIMFCIGAPLVAIIRSGLSAGIMMYFYTLITAVPDAYIGMPVWHILYQSVGIACISGLGAVLVSVLLCWVGSSAPNRSGVVQLLVLLPYLVGGVGCGILFDQLAHIKILTPMMAMVISHVILNYPLAYQLLYAHSATYEVEWTYCAQSLCANMHTIYRTLYWPFMVPAMINALCLSMSLSITEVGASSVVSGNTLMTLSMASRIYRAAGYDVGVLGIVCLICFFAFICALGSSYMQLRSTRH